MHEYISIISKKYKMQKIRDIYYIIYIDQKQNWASYVVRSNLSGAIVVYVVLGVVK